VKCLVGQSILRLRARGGPCLFARFLVWSARKDHSKGRELTLPPLRHGQVIADRYELREEIGSGGMGEVWLAHDRELDRAVALKFQCPSSDPLRFEREAHAAAGVSHPNIVCVYDYGTADGRSYLVLEHLPGGTLASRLESKGALNHFETHAVAHDIAAALAHAHAAGIVHRDVKPSNVIFDEHGHAKLTDFGIARSRRDTTMTAAGGFLGTAAYMAPEQASGETSVGPAADVYSFGVILFQMLTGRLPFEADNILQLARKHRMSPPPAAQMLRPDAPPDLTKLAAHALRKDPAARPQDGTSLLDALDSAPQGETPNEGSVFPAPLPEPRRRSRRRFLALAAFALLAAAGSGTAWLAFGAEETTPAPAPAANQPGSGTGKTPSTEVGSTPYGSIGSSIDVPTTTDGVRTTGATSTKATTTTGTTTATPSNSTTTNPGTTTEAGTSTDAVQTVGSTQP
jgi:serine/threonine protein kinase